MNWKCIGCEHINKQRLKDCEACGKERNLYAEETLQLKGIITKLEVQVKTLKGNLTKSKNEKEKLIKELGEKIFEAGNNIHIINAKENEIKKFLTKELDYLRRIKEGASKIEQAKSLLIPLGQEVAEKDRILKEKEALLNSKIALISHLEDSVLQLDDKNKKKNIILFFSCLFVLAGVVLGIYLYNYKVLLPNKEAVLLTNVNSAFSSYVNSISQKSCLKEIIGARIVLTRDLDKDEVPEGIVVCTYNGSNCKNIFETILYIYKADADFSGEPLNLTVSTSNESVVAFRGVEGGRLIFDKWKLKDYNQAKYDPEQVKNAHTRLYISIDNGILSTTTL